MAQDLHFKSLTQIADDIKQKRVSSEEVVRFLLAHIAAHNERVNAIVTLDEENAVRKAIEADQALANDQDWGPLHGVPVTIKDNIDVAGLRATASAKQYRDNIADEDAPVVERLKNAGCIILGKTNLPRLASDAQTRSPLFGITNNPYDLERTPGGSTGGGAAAVASGMSYAEVGNDALGSIRIPAHYCGLFGMIPSEGIVPMVGGLPKPRQKDAIPASVVMRIVRTGFLARSIDDLALLLTICAGPTPIEPYMYPFDIATTRGPSARDDRAISVAWTLKMGDIPISEETKRLITGFTQQLAEKGFRVKALDSEVVDYKVTRETWNRLVFAPAVAQFPAIVRLLVKLLFRKPGMLSLRRYANAEMTRNREIIKLETLLSDWDVVLLPVCATPAFKHLDSRRKGVLVDGQKLDYSRATTGFTIPFNVTGSPVVVFPVGLTDEGLPVGVQAVGRRWYDLKLIADVQAITRGLVDFTPPPGYATAL